MNFIYFNPDELRANVLGCYGHSLNLTPNWDRLAARGTRFDQCYVQNPVCSPSRCSFMTGTYVHDKGHRSLWHLLQPDEPNTLRYLKEAGYRVEVFGKNDLFSQDSISLAVDKIHNAQGAIVPEKVYEWGQPGYASFLFKPQKGDSKDFYLVKKAIEAIKQWKPGNAPLMLYIPIGTTHPPYTVPEPWYSMVNPENIPSLRTSNLTDEPLYHRMIRETRELDKMDPSDFKKIMAIYLGMTAYQDYLLGLILDALDEDNLWKCTTLIGFSDHGDWAGDYGRVEKWPNAMDDLITRVPMVVRTPGGVEGHVSKEQIECFDIMATTLELAGLEAHHAHHSRSMLPQLHGQSGDPDRAVFCEGGYDEPDRICNESFPGYPGFDIDTKRAALGDPKHNYYPKANLQKTHPLTVSRTVMIRTPKHKLVYRPRETSELYDLENDPEELKNLYKNPSFESIRTDLEKRLLRWYVETADTTPYNRDFRKWN